jgi:hypothetical protein
MSKKNTKNLKRNDLSGLSESEVTDRLRTVIYNTVGNLNMNLVPHIAARLSQPNGYHALEALVIDMMLAQGITVQTALQNIETEEL